MGEQFESWGRYPKSQNTLVQPSGLAALQLAPNSLPVGFGRSYGDSCLNEGGQVVSCTQMNGIERFDPETGIILCQSGVTLEQIIDFCLPYGWFLPVSPGTKYVTVAGAIANDIHGKNHHRGGTFGCHVLSFELVRSDGRMLRCTPEENAELFAATIGGLGLTGFILRAQVQLKRVTSAYIDVVSIQFGNLEEFFAISKESATGYEYTVSWIDCVASGASLGRGIFMRGNHATDGRFHVKKRRLPIFVPFDMPSWFLGPTFVKLFNDRYYSRPKSGTVPYGPYFYPLDAVGKWNRIYGKRGFLQFQCVVPREGIRELLQIVAESGRASFLAVLKEFGDVKSPGLLSFPRPGITLCLDFPMEGQVTLDLFARINQLVAEWGGAQYPAKDATMSATQFKSYYPQWERLEKLRDPNISSGFWRRVTA